MKIDVYLNDYTINYLDDKSIASINHMTLKHFKRITKSSEHFYILRGEPTLHPKIIDILQSLEGKNYILTTHGWNKDVLLNYKGSIPYISFKWDGFLNDKMKGTKGLTDNVMFLLNYFHNNTDTDLRIEYIFSRRNIDWIKPDISIFRKLMSDYDRLKKPYFVLFQQSPTFRQSDYTWTHLGVDHIELLNQAGLLTKKTLDYMNAFVNKTPYKCFSASNNEMVFFYDGTARPCQSLKFNEILGNIEESSLEEIIESSQEKRKELESCPLRRVCWMAYHYKDNISMNKRIFNV